MEHHEIIRIANVLPRLQGVLHKLVELIEVYVGEKL